MQFGAGTFTYLIILSAVLFFASVCYLFRRKDSPGAIFLALLGISSIIWCIGYALELNSETLELKFRAAQLQYFFGIPFTPLFAYLAMQEFTTNKKRPRPLEIIMLSVFPLMSMLIFWLPGTSHLMYENMYIKYYETVSVIEKEPGKWYILMILYSYTLIGTGLFYLVKSYLNSSGAFKKQVLLFILMFIPPIAANIIYIGKFIPGFPLDLTPITFLALVAIMEINIQKHGMLDLIPEARETVIESMGTGIMVVDSDNRIINANMASHRIFNIPQLSGMLISEVFRLAEVNNEPDWNNAAPVSEVEVKGSLYELSVIDINNKRPEENGRIISLYNITERKTTENKLRELNTAKDRLFSIIAHDLKNPLYGIIGLSEMLYEDIDIFTRDEIRGMLKDINDISRNTNTMLENLLNWSRQQIGGIRFSPAEFDIINLISQNLKHFTKPASLKDIKLFLNETGPVFVYADEYMIDTVIRNLISNAIKFTHPGGKIEVNVSCEGNLAVISVKDTGTGIPEEKRNVIFNLNDTARSLGTSGEKGTGLGLPLCKEFIEKNEGSIYFETAAGSGTKFIFTLPVNNKIL